MKILLVDENIDRVGGVERVISTLANRLSTDNDVTVISEYHSSKTPFYKYEKKIKRIYLINSQNRKTNKLKSKNYKYYFFRIFDKFYDLLFKNSKIRSVIKNINEYDVIIFGRVFVSLDFLRFFKKEIKSKVIVRDAIHLKHYPQKVQKDMKKFFPEFVDTFIVSSTESIETYNNFFEKNGKMKMVKIYNPLGIIPKTGYNLNNKVVVSIGRFDEQKGFENLIKAFGIVLNKYPDWKLNLYGDGNYRHVLENTIHDFALEKNVELLPATKDVVKVFNSSSIFVLPSRYEGYANILVEALACGIPSISFDWFMGVEEIIDDNKNGLLVHLKNRENYFNGIFCDEDIVNLAQKIIYLIENPSLCEKFSEESIKIRKNRDIDKIINDWMEII